jgi:hypothetical protein
MKDRKCSRTLPKPVRVFGLKGRKLRLRYVVYPPLDRFTSACRKCRFLESRDNRKFCRIGDPDFTIKYYAMSAKLKGRLFVGSVPLTIKSRRPELYGEIVTFVENHRARSFRARVSSSTVLRNGRNKPELADGRDVLLSGSKSKAGRSEGVE